MKQPPDPHHRHRFPADLISYAVWLDHLFSLSFQDVELLFAERGVIVTYGQHQPLNARPSATLVKASR